MNGATSNFRYDAFGRLIRQWGGSILDRNFIWDGEDLVAALNWNLTARMEEYSYYPGLDRPHAIWASSNSKIQFAHADALGNVVALTDQNTVVTRTYEYDEWGKLVGGVDNGINGANRARFKGALHLGPTNAEFYYMRNRWYEPKSGRFLSEDPLGLAGGINLYAFAGNDPVNNYDPSGTTCTKYQKWRYTSWWRWDGRIDEWVSLGSRLDLIDEWVECDSDEDDQGSNTLGGTVTIGPPAAPKAPPKLDPSRENMPNCALEKLQLVGALAADAITVGAVAAFFVEGGGLMTVGGFKLAIGAGRLGLPYAGSFGRAMGRLAASGRVDIALGWIGVRATIPGIAIEGAAAVQSTAATGGLTLSDLLWSPGAARDVDACRGL